MRPKVEACVEFARTTGRPADRPTGRIGALADAPEVLAGRAGTTISLRP